MQLSNVFDITTAIDRVTGSVNDGEDCCTQCNVNFLMEVGRTPFQHSMCNVSQFVSSHPSFSLTN